MEVEKIMSEKRKKGRPQKIFLTKEIILKGMQHTKSIKALARYLRVSYPYLKPYMKLFKDEETGKTFYEIHKNQNGKGIKKFLKNGYKSPDVKIIFKQGIGYESFTPEKIKSHGIREGYLKEECYNCGFCERRIIDFKVPLLMNFKDGNRQNYLLDNIELLCYNCYFLTIGNVFTPDQVRRIEDYIGVKTKPFEWELEKENIPEDPKTEWNLNAEQIENMKRLGLWDEENKNKEDGSEFITRKI